MNPKRAILTDSADEAAHLHWPEGVEDRSKMVMPGDNVEMMCDIYNPIAIESGQRFNIREGTYPLSCRKSLLTLTLILGGRTVATGLITRVLN